MDTINIKYYLKNVYDCFELESLDKFVINNNVIEYAQIFVDIINFNQKSIFIDKFLEHKKKNNRNNYEKYKHKIKKIEEAIQKKKSLLNDFFKNNNNKQILFLSDFIIFVGIIWYKKHFYIDMNEIKLVELIGMYINVIYKKGKITDFTVPDEIPSTNVSQFSNIFHNYTQVKIYSRISFLVSHYIKYIKIKNNVLHNTILLIKRSWYNFRLRNIIRFSHLREKNESTLLNIKIAIHNNSITLKPNINDRENALQHYNKFFEIEQCLSQALDPTILKKYIYKRSSPIHVNWPYDVTLWFVLIYVIKKNCFTNIDSLDKLTDFCLKYALYNDLMLEKNDNFIFHRPHTDYSDYFYLINNKKYCIESDFKDIPKYTIFKKRFIMVQNTETFLFNTNFNIFFEKNKKNKKNKKNYAQSHYDKWDKNRYNISVLNEEQLKNNKIIKQKNKQKSICNTNNIKKYINPELLEHIDEELLNTLNKIGQKNIKGKTDNKMNKKKNKIRISNVSNITEEVANKNAEELIADIIKEEVKIKNKNKKKERLKKNKQLRINSAIIIQQYLRYKFIKSKYILKKKKTIIVQKYLRCYLDKKNFYKKKKSILLIQSYLRMYNIIKQVNKIKFNLIEEQKKKFQEQIDKLNIMQKKIIHEKKIKYAIKIQTFWRLYYTKYKFLKKYINSLKKTEIRNIQKKMEYLIKKLNNIDNKYNSKLEIINKFSLRDKYKNNSICIKNNDINLSDSISSTSTIGNDF
jgi:hypothetical protein